MGSRGPAPVPTEILKNRGSWLAKTRTVEPKPEAVDRLPCPQELDARGRKIWQELVKYLAALGMLTTIDKNSLVRYCSMQARWWTLYLYVKEHGEFRDTVDKDGNVTVSLRRQAIQMDKVNHDLLHLEREFGLTPSARARMGMPPQKKDKKPHGNQKDKARFFAS